MGALGENLTTIENAHIKIGSSFFSVSHSPQVCDSYGDSPRLFFFLGPLYCSYTVVVREEHTIPLIAPVVYSRRFVSRISIVSFNTDLENNFPFTSGKHTLMYAAERCKIPPHHPPMVAKPELETAVACRKIRQCYEHLCPLDVVPYPAFTTVTATFTLSQPSQFKLFIRCPQWNSLESLSCSRILRSSSVESLGTSSISLALPASDVSCSYGSPYDDYETETITKDDVYPTAREGAGTYTVYEPKTIRIMSAAPRAGAGTVTLNVCWNSGHSKYIDGGSNTPSESYLRTYGSELDGVAALYEEESSPHLEKRDKVKPCEDHAEELIENQEIGPAPPPPLLVSDAAGDFRMNTGADWSAFYAASAQDKVKPCEDYAGELIENQAIGPVPLPPLLVSDAAGDFSMNTGADWSTFYAESAQAFGVAFGDQPAGTNRSLRCTPSQWEPGSRGKRRWRLRRLLINLLCCCSLPNVTDVGD